MAARPRISPFRWLFLALLGLGVLGLCCLVAVGNLKRTAAPETAGGSLYAADIPLSTMPAAVAEGMVLLSAEELVRVPEIDGFQAPLGTANGAMAYDAQPFGADNPKRGGHHTGQDLNGIGGENTDEGTAVHAAARGLVVFSGMSKPGWGKVVVLAHRLPGTNRIIQTLYAHLKDIEVRHGQLVARGQRIGSVGTGEGQYLAHLHYEAVESRCVEAGMPGYHKDGTMNRLDPEALAREFPAPAAPDAYAAVRRIRIREAYNSTSSDTPTQVPEGTIPVNPSQLITP